MKPPRRRVNVPSAKDAVVMADVVVTLPENVRKRGQFKFSASPTGS